jgi:hypothetical protein
VRQSTSMETTGRPEKVQDRRVGLAVLAAIAIICKMHRDRKELLIGFGAIVLFGVSLIVWPPFAEFVDRFAFSYLRDLFNLLRGIVL